MIIGGLSSNSVIKFLLDAYFLYLNVDLEICKNRVRERITHPSTDDDFYVSEYIFKSYYYGDDGRSIRQMLTEVYGIDVQRVIIIDNNGSALRLYSLRSISLLTRCVVFRTL